MISIIIPVFNQAAHLANLLNSLKRQTYDNYEIIIINDGSNDGVENVVEKYQQIFHFKLSYFEQENQGANSARNRGAKIAKGEYLIFCDADIVMEPTMLKLMLGALKHNPGASFCYSSFIWGKKKFKLWPYDVERLKSQPCINMCSLIKKAHFSGLDQSIKRFQDWDLWLTMLEQGHFGIWLNQYLYKVGTGGSQTMSRWLPSFFYQLMPFLPAVKKYNQAKKIIMEKHKFKLFLS